MVMLEAADAQPVTVTWQQLNDGVSSETLQQAYGPDGLGILVISGIPGLQQLRSTLLPLVHKLANFSEDVLQLYEDAASRYNLGWSHGREAMSDGRPDLSKGSFYANPEVECPAQVTPADATSYPEYCRPNIWPTQHLPSLQHACQQAGMVAIDAGYLLARSIDSFLQHTRKQHAGGVDGPSLEGLLRASQCHKGRLLHYFPPSTSDDGVHDDSWCGWHFDHSALTALYPAMFLSEGTQDAVEVPSPDPAAGLYIEDRKGAVHKVGIPHDCLAVQLGEAAEVVSGGRLRATRHMVRGPRVDKAQGISRNTFAVFMQPRWNVPLAPCVPPLAEAKCVEHYKPGMTFGEFANAKFAQYYA